MERAERVDADTRIDAVLRAANVLLRVVAQSVAEVEATVTSPQLRVLVMIATRGAQNAGAVAAELGVHPSNATRTCDRLVRAGLVVRHEAPGDRRYVALSLTPKGKSLVSTVLEHRRAAVAEVMDRVPEELRNAVAIGMGAFAAADGGEGTEDGRFTVDLRS
ncbi:MarR family winged helix-turn-helix transcriptional regulator [Arthrobacter bambusae]|uniref:MarR family winged helix-turn-helix transcriptional regulator n=1 Tax=Arthrobacter bambusae TaxID=1338426 RepID=UPI002781C405|nr:MarR family transcriptional regulator [Arthrobacter bambusae]MDQ0028650.1 DNA-binding MarR family transcriptional regulator [Arthrobacter bambusae]MDQ0096556.1 DNA-binding MarR family transcriptional regulator [Arthrobacter bambusae]